MKTIQVKLMNKVEGFNKILQLLLFPAGHYTSILEYTARYAAPILAPVKDIKKMYKNYTPCSFVFLRTLRIYQKFPFQTASKFREVTKIPIKWRSKSI